MVPIIADIGAGFGNEHATYLLAKALIKAGACCLQIENRVSDAKQCGHQDGKMTVPREDFLEKLRAGRLDLEELGVEGGVIVARADSLGAGLTRKVPVSQAPGDLAADYIKWLDPEAITEARQRAEIRRGIAAVKHQHEVGSDLGDSFKEMVGGAANTMNQFAAE
ncbi:MAG: isocitrate lyase/phosphoenolpyruvate mutase family protein [Pseudodonghicola sp.]